MARAWRNEEESETGAERQHQANTGDSWRGHPASQDSAAREMQGALQPLGRGPDGGLDSAHRPPPTRPSKMRPVPGEPERRGPGGCPAWPQQPRRRRATVLEGSPVPTHRRSSRHGDRESEAQAGHGADGRERTADPDPSPHTYTQLICR